MSCNEWKEYRLEDISQIIFSGGTPSTRNEEFWDGDIPWLSSGETRNSFINKTEKTITEEGVKNSSTKLALNGDIVIASAGQGFTRGQVSFCNIDTYINQSLIAIRANNILLNNKYLYYNLKSRYNELRQISDSHSIRGSLTTKMIKDLIIKLPSLEEQEKIANILSSLDDKIELNNEMNKTLEEMAQSIFKRWFVDFEFPNEDGKPYKSSGGEMVDSELGMIPKGWEVKTIDNLCEVGSSKRIFMKEYVDSGVPFYRGKEIIEKSKGNSISTELFITKERFEEIKEKFGVPNKNDILLTSVGTLGVAYLVDDEEFYFKDGNLTWFKNFKEEIYRYFIYQWIISSEGKKSIDAITIGSTQKALTINTLKGMKLVLPSNDILSLFEGFIKSNINNIRSNNEEKSNLIDIRNSLLTKLMSGEIDINL